MNPTLDSLSQALNALSPIEREVLLRSIATKPASLLAKPIDGLGDWINDLQLRGHSKNTIELYSRAVRNYLLKDPTPTPQSVRAFLANSLQSMTLTKVRNDQKAMKSFFSFLEAQKLWLDNPVKDMKLRKITRVIRKAPPTEDVEKLLLVWEHSDKRLKQRVLIALFVDTGVRLSEACSIRLDDVDLASQRIKVLGKGNKERLVYISPVTEALIRRYLRQLPKDTEYLFPADNRNGYQCIRAIDKTFKRLSRKLGIKPITPHMLRHYFATQALKNGAKLEIVSKMLGHASVGITADVYRTIEQEEIQAEHQKFSPLAANTVTSPQSN